MSWKTLKHPGSRRIKKVFFVLRSSSSPDGPWINHPPIQDQAPTALEESTIVHHPFIQDQAPTALGSTNPYVQPFFKIKPKSPWRSVHHCSSKIKPKSPFEDPLKSTFKIKSMALEERIFRVHKLARPVGPSLPLISFSVQEIQARFPN
ncbi:hypothetical protein ACFX2I_033752 [Malus domestica]